MRLIQPGIVDYPFALERIAPRLFQRWGELTTEAPEDRTMNTITAAQIAVYIGRVFFTLALLALIGAWITQLNDGRLFGMSQQHLFNDAMVLALLGIGSFLDAFWHARRV